MKSSGHRCRDFLVNIQEAINDIEKTIQNMTYEEFAKNKTTQALTHQNIEIIAKASTHIPQIVKQQNPEFPWKKMAAMADELALAYLEMDPKNLYKTAKQTIPPLKAPIEKMLH